MKLKENGNKQTIFYCCLILLFSVSSILLMLRHEQWRDETRPWIYARDYPMGSYFLTREIYGATYPIEITHIIPSILFHMGLPYVSMPITNFFVILTSIVLVLFYAPFSKLQKILFVFGYYIFYEYNILARSWSFSILFLCCLAVLYKDRFKRPILYNTLLFLLALTHIYIFLLAGILAVAYYVELFQQARANRKNYTDTKASSFTRVHFFCLVILMMGLLYIFYPSLNPKNVPLEFSEWKTELSIYHFGTIPQAVVDAYLPIPKLQVNFWQSRGISRALYGLPIFLLTLLFFMKKKEPLFIYIAMCSALFGVFFFRIIGAFRHHGLLFIIFIFCLWIAKEYKENEKMKFGVSQKTLGVILTILLSIQVVAAGIAFYYDWQYDFSPAKRAASFLKENNFLNNETFIMSYPSVEMASILVRTPEYPKFYFMEYGEFRSFMVHDKKTSEFNARPHPLSEITGVIVNATKNKEYASVLLILDRKIKQDQEGYEQYSLLASFENNIINDPMYIYTKK